MRYIYLILSILAFSCSVFAYRTGDKVLLIVAPGCHACVQAEADLDRNHITYTSKQGTGFVPRLYVNGHYKGVGTDAVTKYINE